MRGNILQAVQSAATRIEALKNDAENEHNWNETILEDFHRRANTIFPSEQRQVVRSRAAAFRSVTRRSYVTAEISAVLSGFPASAEILPIGIRQDSIVAPNDVPLVETNFAQRVEWLLSEHFLKPMTQMPSQIGAQIVAAEPAVREAVHLVTYGVEVAARKKEDDAAVKMDLVHGALERAQQRCIEVHRELTSAADAVQDGAEKLVESLPALLQELLQRKKTSAEMMRTSVAASAKTALIRHSLALRQWLSIRWKPLAQFVSGASKRSVEEWQIQSGAIRLDAIGIAQYCAKRIPAMEHLDIPRVYKEGLTLEPLSDRRMLAASRRLIENTITALMDKNDDANLLLVGARGSGRTTVAAELHFRLPHRRVLRFDGAMLERGDDLILALAEDLGCATDAAIVKERLKEERPIIILDDLERVFSPTQAGISQLLSWFNFIISTAGNAKWVVTVNNEMLPVFIEMGLPVEKAFGRIVTLLPLDWRKLREVITARQRLTGIPVRMGRQLGVLDFLFNRRQGSRESQYYRSLENASGGNLRAALLTHLHSLKRDGAGITAKQPRRFSLPFLPWIPTEAVALLAQLIRLGPMSEKTIRESFALSPAELEGLILFLRQAGLVEQRLLGYKEMFQVPLHLEDAMVAALGKLHLFEEAAS
jgi:hypothetical protein